MSDVKKRKALHSCGHCWAVFLTALLWPLYVQADLKEDIDRAIIKGNAADTSRTDHEKLFVYRCESIAKATGFSETASGRATKYSCDQPGVGIAFYAGSDLGRAMIKSGV